MQTQPFERDLNAAADPGYREPSLATLITDMTDQLTTLVRREMELARVETQENMSRLVKSAATMVAGGVIAYAGLIVVLLAVAYGLAAVIPLWVSTLIVGAITIAIGAFMLMAGRSAMAEVNLVPEKTIQSVQNNVDMIKEKVQ